MKTRITRDIAAAHRPARPIPAALGTAGWAQAQVDRARIRTVLRAPPDWRGPETRSVPASTTKPGDAAAQIARHAAAALPPVIQPYGGQRLDPSTRTHMEARFGEDFSDVRIHTGYQAAKTPTKAADNPRSSRAPQQSTLAGCRLGHDPVEQALFLRPTIGNQATLRLLAQQTSRSAVRDPRGDYQHGGATENTMTGETSRGASWDFSKIPLFPPDWVNPPGSGKPAR